MPNLDIATRQWLMNMAAAAVTYYIMKDAPKDNLSRKYPDAIETNSFDTIPALTIGG